MANFKKWTGSKWVDINPKKWNGSKWVDVNVYKWTGSKWVNLTTQEYTKTWNATWSQTYQGSNYKRNDWKGQQRMYQGRYKFDPDYGIMRSMCGFNDSDIISTLSGAKIKDVKIYLRNQHWYYKNGGGTVVLGYHNKTYEHNVYSEEKYDAKRQRFYSRGQARWIDMPNSFGTGLRDGKYRGFTIRAHVLSNNISYYGYFYGAGSSSRPKIKITYEN